MGRINDWWNNKIETPFRNWLDDHKVINAITKPFQWAYNAVDIPHEALIATFDGIKGVLNNKIDEKSSSSSASGNVTSTPTIPIGGNGSQSVQQSTSAYNDAFNTVADIVNQQVDTTGGVVNDLLGITHAVGMNNQYDLAKWQLENAYNSPTEQMRRLKDAGLNPNLIYGNGQSASTGNAGSIGSSHVDPIAGASMSLQLLSGASQIGKTLTEISNIDQNTKKQERETEMLIYSIEKEKQSVENLIAEYDKLRAEIGKINSETRLNQLDVIYKEYINNNLDLDLMQRRYNLTETEMRILEITAGIEKTQAETNSISERLNMDIWTFNNVDRLDAVIKANEADISTMDKVLKEMYGQRDAATNGMSGFLGNVTKGLGGIIGEIKYMSKNRRYNRNNN